MSPLRRWFGLLFACVLLLGAADAWAQSTRAHRAQLKRRLQAAARLYEALEYEKALEQLKHARALRLSVNENATVAIYQGLVLADLGRKEQAVLAFKEGLALKPNAKLPFRVSPKVVKLFEEVRRGTQRTVARLGDQDDALLREEDEGAEAERLQAEQERLKAERLQAERRAVEEARLLAERLDAERKAAEEARVVAERLEAERKAAELQTARLRQEREAMEEARRRAEAAARDAPVAPRPDSEGRASRLATAPAPASAAQQALTPGPRADEVRGSTSVAPFVFLGLAAVAGGAGGYFGVTSKDQAEQARGALYQDDTVRYLESSRGNALAANVLLGAAGTALIGSIIGFVVSGGDEAPATAQEGGR